MCLGDSTRISSSRILCAHRKNVGIDDMAYIVVQRGRLHGHYVAASIEGRIGQSPDASGRIQFYGSVVVMAFCLS